MHIINCVHHPTGNMIAVVLLQRFHSGLMTIDYCFQCCGWESRDILLAEVLGLMLPVGVYPCLGTAIRASHCCKLLRCLALGLLGVGAWGMQGPSHSSGACLTTSFSPAWQARVVSVMMCCNDASELTALCDLGNGWHKVCFIIRWPMKGAWLLRPRSNLPLHRMSATQCGSCACLTPGLLTF